MWWENILSASQCRVRKIWLLFIMLRGVNLSKNRHVFCKLSGIHNTFLTFKEA